MHNPYQSPESTAGVIEPEAAEPIGCGMLFSAAVTGAVINTWLGYHSIHFVTQVLASWQQNSAIYGPIYTGLTFPTAFIMGAAIGILILLFAKRQPQRCEWLNIVSWFCLPMLGLNIAVSGGNFGWNAAPVILNLLCGIEFVALLVIRTVIAIRKR